MKEGTSIRLDKAGRAIRAASRALADGDGDCAANRAYYAMFYVAEALLSERGMTFSKHSGVHAAFGSHYAKTGLLDAKYHRYLIEAFMKRLESDYGIQTTLTHSEIVAMIERANEFLGAARRFLAAE